MKILTPLILILLFTVVPSASGQIFQKNISWTDESLSSVQQFNCKFSIEDGDRQLSTNQITIWIDSNEIRITEHSGYNFKLKKVRAIPRVYYDENTVTYYCRPGVLTMRWDDCTDRYTFRFENKKDDESPVIEFYGCTLVSLPEKINLGAK